MTRLRNLLSANRGRGSGIRAEGSDLFLYDMIVSTDDEAEYFGGVAASAFVAALKGMRGPVNLRINSPGGDVFAARAMQQAMRDYPDAIVCHVDGYAASAASLIAVTGSECLMAPGAFLMIHKAWTVGIGNSDDLMQTAALLEQIDGSLAETYAAKAGGKPEEWAALMKAETWFSADAAVAAGLADAKKDDAPKMKAAWNLAAFANAPQVEEPAPVAGLSNADRQRMLARLNLVA